MRRIITYVFLIATAAAIAVAAEAENNTSIVNDVDLGPSARRLPIFATVKPSPDKPTLAGYGCPSVELAIVLHRYSWLNFNRPQGVELCNALRALTDYPYTHCQFLFRYGYRASAKLPPTLPGVIRGSQPSTVVFVSIRFGIPDVPNMQLWYDRAIAARAELLEDVADARTLTETVTHALQWSGAKRRVSLLENCAAFMYGYDDATSDPYDYARTFWAPHPSDPDILPGQKGYVPTPPFIGIGGKGCGCYYDAAVADDKGDIIAEPQSYDNQLCGVFLNSDATPVGSVHLFEDSYWSATGYDPATGEAAGVKGCYAEPVKQADKGYPAQPVDKKPPAQYPKKKHATKKKKKKATHKKKRPRHDRRLTQEERRWGEDEAEQERRMVASWLEDDSGYGNAPVHASQCSWRGSYELHPISCPGRVLSFSAASCANAWIQPRARDQALGPRRQWLVDAAWDAEGKTTRATPLRANRACAAVYVGTDDAAELTAGGYKYVIAPAESGDVYARYGTQAQSGCDVVTLYALSRPLGSKHLAVDADCESIGFSDAGVDGVGTAFKMVKVTDEAAAPPDMVDDLI